MSLPRPFPSIDVSSDYDPGIRLFGKRFYIDQSNLEYISEFLGVVYSDKWIGSSNFSSALPPRELLVSWADSNQELRYNPGVRLNLKLFAFLPNSRTETRHPVHREQYWQLVNRLKDSIRTQHGDSDDVVAWLGEWLRGLLGAGYNRTWCAQSFWPVSQKLITQETLWNETTADREPPSSWDDSIERLSTFYSVAKHRFQARGGELLYLQICNALMAKDHEVDDLARSVPSLTREETDPVALHERLEAQLTKLRGKKDDAVERILDHLEFLDPNTPETTSRKVKPLECQWCPRESWREGYLFAVELSRLLDARIDTLELIDLLMTGSVLHVLRSLCAQGRRYVDTSTFGDVPNHLGYVWAIAPPGHQTREKTLSHETLLASQRMIYQAIRSEKLQENAKKDPHRSPSALNREADTRYGHKLFLALAKRIGFVAPRKGPGARFVMTDSILRYLVLSLIRSGERCTYDRFLDRLYGHYGMALQGGHLDQALNWIRQGGTNHYVSQGAPWMLDMLRAGGFLHELSDACSIVQHSF